MATHAKPQSRPTPAVTSKSHRNVFSTLEYRDTSRQSSLTSGYCNGGVSEQGRSRLTVGPRDDGAEREANRVADQVLAKPLGVAMHTMPSRIQRYSATPAFQPNSAPASVDRVLAHPGKPMTAALREDMEPRFDHDFSSVRIHADMLAAKSARDLNARAYTVGHDIVFGSGQFAAGTRQGRHLIAHELTHVVQQRGAGGIVQRVPDAEDPKSDDQSSMPALDEGQVQSSGIKVDQLNVITSPAGAFSGFPVAKGIDLNTPGPFNDTTTMGSCVNVHQMQFHLSKGDPNEVKLLRRVVRVSSAGGKETREGEKDKPKDDGPSAGSVIRPKESPNVVVADAPGFVGFGDASKSKGVFPVSYDADFDLFATDRVEPRFLAKLQYTVRISKKAPDDANPVNEIKVQTRKLF